MKGVPTSCIEYYDKVHTISALELYSRLFDGVPIGFDLTSDNNKCDFKNSKDHTVKS